MKVSSVLFVCGALVIALGGAFVIRGLTEAPVKPKLVSKPVSQSAVTAKPAPVYAPVLAASRDIHPGEFIDGGAIHWQVVNKDYPKELYIKMDKKGSSKKKTKDLIDLASNFGATVREPVKKGELLTYSLVVKPGEPGFLASVLRSGMRAVAIPITAVTSNSGLVSAGDYVDVILGLVKSKESNGASSPAPDVELKMPILPVQQMPILASQTLLTNVRVLALNHVVRSEVKVNAKDEKNSEYPLYETATLEVTPKQSEQLAVAREVGSLQLALRSVDDSSSDISLANKTDVTTLNQTTDIYQALQKLNRSIVTQVEVYKGESTETVQWQADSSY